MPREDYWRIDADAPGVDDIVLDGHEGPESNQQYADGYTLPVLLTARSDSPTGEWPGYEERYRRLLTFRHTAGAFYLHGEDNTQPAFTEYHDGESLLITLKPPAESAFGRGGFYLVEGFEDRETLPSKLGRLALDLTFVAKYDTGDTGEAGYRTRREVRSALEAPTLI